MATPVRVDALNRRSKLPRYALTLPQPRSHGSPNPRSVERRASDRRVQAGRTSGSGGHEGGCEHPAHRFLRRFATLERVERCRWSSAACSRGCPR